MNGAPGVDAVDGAGEDLVLLEMCIRDRVSMGNVFLVPWTYLPEGESWPDLLHDLGFRTVALALRENSLALNDPRLLAEPKLAMVLGTEGDGLASSTIASCDYTVKIPMSHGVDSLNAVSYTHLDVYKRQTRSRPGPCWSRTATPAARMACMKRTAVR